MARKISLIIMVVLCSLTPLAAQSQSTASIDGTVVDPSNAVRGGAIVTLRDLDTGLSRSLRTGIDGRFESGQLAPGRYQVIVDLSGFETVLREVTLTAGQKETIQFPLALSRVRQNIVVSAPAQAATATSETVMTRETLEGEHAQNMNDYFFAGVPGVSTARRSNLGFSGPGAGFSIRGLTNTRVTVFVDDLPVQVNSHFHARSDQYSADMIDRMQITRGPSAVLHGPSAVGGVVDIYTRTPRKGLSGFVQAEAGGLRSRQALGDIGYGWDSGNVLFSALNWSTDAQAVGEGFALRNLNLKVTQRLAQSWNATVRLERAKEPASNATSSDPKFVFFKFREDLDTYVVSLDHTTANTRSVAAFRFNSLNTSSFRESGARGRFLDISRREDEYGAVLKHSWVRGVETLVTAGSDFVTYSDNRTNGAGTAPRAKNDLSYVSPYVWASQAVGAGTKLEGGLRYTHSTDYRSNLSPELGIVHHFGDTTAVRVRGGKAFRLPRVDEVKAPFATASPNLKPEDFTHAEAGVNQQFGSRAEFDIDAWTMRGRNLLQTIGTGAAARSMNTGRFSNHGGETTFRFGVTRDLGVSLGAALMKIDKALNNVPQRTLDLGVDFRHVPFRATLTARHAAKNTNVQLGDYTVADARLSFQITPHFLILGDVDNLTNEKYATLTTFSGPLQQVPRTFFAGVRTTWGER
ncbi:MAG: hypothetical protein NVSMB68_02860 [Thermoanaerobaculia bacterium]